MEDGAGAREIHVPPLRDRHEFGDLEDSVPGSWARYRITREGLIQDLTLAAIEKTGDRVWLEVVENGDPRRASLRLVLQSGRIEQAWYREVPAKGEPSAILPQPLVASEEPRPRPVPSDIRRRRAEEDLPAGRKLAATVLIEIYRDELLGREYREESAWSREIPPLLAGTDDGGLIRRKAPKGSVQLVDFGTGYQALVPFPK